MKTLTKMVLLAVLLMFSHGFDTLPGHLQHASEDEAALARQIA